MYKEQTDKMLADGGVMQQGGTKDEVSGNDVPVGSLKEEVRDDVDAKLSVGEFVVPADVVRYIGLENLMKMRDKAKAGLQKMSDIGQMGNAEEAKTPEDEEDVTEFSSAVDDVMGEEEADVKMAVGGYVQPENAKTYANAPLKGFEMVSLVNDAGNVIYIPYVNGKPQLSIPSGYKVKTGAVDTTAAAVTAPVAPVTTTGGMTPTTTTSDSGGGDGTSGGGAPAGLGGVVGSSVSPSTVGMVGSVVGGPIGLGINLGKSVIANALTSSIASQNQASVAAQMGLTPSEAATTIGQAAVSSAIDSTPNIGENIGTTATTGPAGTGSAAVAAASAAADAAAANGMSAAAIGAASQAAADAALGGASPSAAATAGGAAAAATQGIADAVAANNAAIGDTGGGSVSGGSDSGPGVGTGSGVSGGDTGGVSGGGGDGSTGVA